MIPLRKFKNLCNHIRISTSSSIFTKNNPSTPIERVRRISYSYIPLLRLLKNESRPFQTCPREISPVACLVRRGGKQNEEREKDEDGHREIVEGNVECKVEFRKL